MAVHVLKFRTRCGVSYVVNVEEYGQMVFALKFYRQSLAGHDLRFKLLSGNFDAAAVLSTCVNIIGDFLSKNPFASFAFVGAWSAGESSANSKRFRVYQKVVAALISPLQFEHHAYPKNSAYLLLNRHQLENDPDLQTKIEAMFRARFDFE